MRERERERERIEVLAINSKPERKQSDGCPLGESRFQTRWGQSKGMALFSLREVFHFQKEGGKPIPNESPVPRCLLLALCSPFSLGNGEKRLQRKGWEAKKEQEAERRRRRLKPFLFPSLPQDTKKSCSSPQQKRCSLSAPGSLNKSHTKLPPFPKP